MQYMSPEAKLSEHGIHLRWAVYWETAFGRNKSLSPGEESSLRNGNNFRCWVEWHLVVGTQQEAALPILYLHLGNLSCPILLQ